MTAAFAEGDDVFGMAASGGYAEFATASAAAIARKPDGISHEQAAAIPVAGMTAWQALFDRGGLESGQTALIAGAAGGVGHLAVQFAKHAGARVIGTGSSRNRDFVLGLGADEYVDYTEQDVGEAVSGVDVAFDTVGGETTESLVPTLREGGILVTIANAPPEEAARERGARAELLVMSPSSEQLARIAELVAAGDVHVEISEVLPLDRGPARPGAQRVRSHARQDRPDGRDLTKAAQGRPRYSVGSSASPAKRSAPAMPRGRPALTHSACSTPASTSAAINEMTG